MKLKIALFLLLLCNLSWGQVTMTTTGSYTQDFNGLSSTTAATPAWADNTTIANWYAQRTGTGTTYSVGTGSANAGALYSFGSTSASDRALGTVGSGNAAAGSFAEGLLLQNTSGNVITNLTIAYTGEQWRKENVAAQTVSFYYKIASSAITALNPNSNGTWTAVAALNFVSVQNSAGSGALDGNLGANRTVISAVAIPSLSLANNEYIMIKWDDPDHTGSDHGLAIDDVTVNWTTAPLTPPVVTPGSATGYLTVPFFYNVSASNFPTSFFATGLPPGLSINSSGVISGTPTAPAGTYNASVTATNGAGTSSAATISITINALPPPTVTGGTANGTVGVPMSYFVTNTNAASFAISSGTLPSGLSFNTTTGEISGTPSATGTSVISVTATNASGTSAPASITITIAPPPAPEINVKGIINTNPSIFDGDVSPSGTDNTLFASIVVGNSQTKNFRIENTGNATLTVNSITFTGANPGDFSISGLSFPFTVAALGSQDFSVIFAPTAAGTRNATLNISSDDVDEATYDFAVRGTGIALTPVEMNVKGNGNSIADGDMYPAGTDWTAFGVATVGVTTVTRVFTIENLGTATLNLTGTPIVKITGTHASMFSVTVQPPATVGATSSTTFTVVFNPTAPGAKSAMITIDNNDSNENPYNFAISGNAKGANNIYVYGNGNDVIKNTTTTSVANLTDFGSTAVTTGVKQNTFVVTNLSGSDEFFGSVSITGADASMFTVVSQPINTAVVTGNSTSFTINFTPTSAGTKNATISFNSYKNAALSTADPVDPTFTFAISGYGDTYTPCTNGVVQTIGKQDFEDTPASPTWNYTYTTDGSVNVQGGTYDNGSGAKNAYLGAKSFQFTGFGSSSGTAIEKATIVMDPVDVSQYNNINLSFRVGAFRSTSGQGLDIDDVVQVESSIDGGTNWSVEAVLKGYSNVRWDFAATGIFTAYYTGTNNAATIDARLGSGIELATGYSTFNVKSLPASSNLMLRVVLNVDRNDEIWAIDNVQLEGQIPQSTTWNGSAWSAGTPTSSMKAIIDGAYDTAVNGNIQACELQVNSGKTLTVGAGNYLEIQSNLTNNGTLVLNDDSSLVQLNNAAVNTGNIVVKRAVNMKKLDYVYWSTPVANFPVSSISPTTVNIYKWLPTIGGNFGNWTATTETMVTGKGYIVRGPSAFDATLQTFTATFTGVPNNGIIKPSIERGGYTGADYTNPANGVTVTKFDDNFNLIGNPYPSSVHAINFLLANTNIDGTIRLWTHGTLPTTSASDPFYGNFQYNYTNSDYIIYNSTGASTGPGAFNGLIASGQGFFVTMLDGAADATQSVIFNNSMRDKSYNNNQFYRHSSASTDAGEPERHRIWLDLIGPNTGGINRILVGYVEGATTGRDRMFDAIARINNGQDFYSLIGEQQVSVQGRPTPFDNQDLVPLGFKAAMASNDYKIAIAAVDGLFAGNTQPVFLEDRMLNIVHDLKQSPYTFASQTGIFNDRFYLRYGSPLATETFLGGNALMVASGKNEIKVRSTAEVISAISIYDVLGREIYRNDSVGKPDFTIANLTANNQALVMKIKLADGQTFTRKIIY